MTMKIKLYINFATLAVRSVMMHRTSFIVGCIGQFLGYGASFLATYKMISNFNIIGGWTASQVLYLYGFNLLGYALAACVFFNPSRNLANKVRSGELDLSLTKPVHPLSHELLTGFNPGYVNHLCLSVLTMAITAKDAGFPFTVGSVILWLIMLLSAALIHGALLLLTSAGGFLFIRNNPIGMITDIGKQFVEYPITIYPKLVQILLTFVLPYAFLNFYPVAAILNLEMTPPYLRIVAYFTPVMGCAILAIGIRVWNVCLSRYQSTGN